MWVFSKEKPCTGIPPAWTLDTYVEKNIISKLNVYAKEAEKPQHWKYRIQGLVLGFSTSQ